MGQLLYSGKWAIEPSTELDYIINYTIDRSEQHVSVDEVYLDLEQATAVLAAGSAVVQPSPANFQRILRLGDRDYCPIAEFMARAARKTAKSSRVFKVKIFIIKPSPKRLQFCMKFSPFHG